MTDLGRVVHDARSGMGYKFSARVVEHEHKSFWTRKVSRVWRYHIDKHFVNWSADHFVSKNFDDPGDCLKAANAWLDWVSNVDGVPVR